MEQQSSLEDNSKNNVFAITSFILGVIEMTTIVNFIINIDFYLRIDTPLAIKLSMLIAPLVGLVFGILGLKSTYRQFSIAGIILCSIPFLEVIYLFFLSLVAVGTIP